MKKTTIWINQEGVPMHRPGGWPEVPDEKASINAEMLSMRAYEKYLDKAKKEAIRFDDEYAIKRTLLHLVEYTPNAHVDEIWMNAKWPRHGDPKPDSFVDIEGEVTTIWQFKLNGKWHDFSSDAVEVVNRYANEGAETRQVARLKPAEGAYPLQSIVREAIGQLEDSHAAFPHPEDFCQRCGARNTVWFAQNDLWNKVMGGDGGIVCPECFRKSCSEIGEKIIFEAKSVNSGDDKDKRIKELEDALADMVTAPVPPVWINVADRMPEPGVKVLCVITYGAGNREVTLSYTTNRFPDVFDHFHENRITHWAYTPKLPIKK